MEINYELKPDDLFEFSKETASAQKNHKPMVIIYAITYLLFIFADIIYAVIFGSLSDWNFASLILNILIRTAFTFAVIAVILTFIKLFAVKKVKDVLSQESENGVFCEHKIILSENQLVELTDINTSQYSWKSIGEIKELEQFVSIEVLMSFSYIIPKRYFKDRQHIKDFLDTAKTYKQNSLLAYSPSHLAAFDEKSSNE